MPSERTFMMPCIKLLTLTGGGPKRTTYQNVMIFIVFSAISSAICMNFVQLLVYDVTYEMFFKIVDSGLLLLQGSVRIILLFINRKEFAELIKHTKLFRKVHTIKKKKMQADAYWRLAMFWYFCASDYCFAVFFHIDYCILPFFTSGENLPISTYMPTFLNFYHMLMYQNIVFGLFVIFAAAHDLLINTLLVTASVQFKILHDMILSLDLYEDNLDEDLAYRKLQEIIDYHNVLLKFVYKFKRVYSFLLLFHLANFIITMCADLYVFSVKKSLSVFILIFGLFIQVVIMFCIPGQYISDEAEHLINAIYNLNWYNIKSVKIKKAILLMLQKCQEPVNISAGNYSINYKTGLDTLRLSLSFFMCINTVGNNKNEY